MRIGGIIDISTKDIPNRSAMVLFTIGCNLTCEFCHNKHLLNKSAGKEMEISEIIRKIAENTLVSSVSITGGEPTIQPDITELCKKINKIGKFLSIDTNGTNPEVIRKTLPYINRVALDIKGPFIKERFVQITGSTINLNNIISTFKQLNEEKDIDLEVRTTFVDNLMSTEDIHQILSWLQNNNFRGNFVLQQYQYSEGVGEPHKAKFQKPEHIVLINILKPYSELKLPFNIFLRDDVVGYTLFENVK